jgi:NDP-mannose synthase
MTDEQIAALIMAGGRSDRMRAGGCSQHKALRRVLGVPLIERNLTALLSFGFRNVFVAISADEPELLAWIKERGRSLAESAGARINSLLEPQALGTIGAVACLPALIENAAIVNVDNLTNLDLNAFVRFHLERQAAATIAAHDEPFRIPFGHLETDNEVVTGYDEKPEILVTISSGTYVLNRRAIERVLGGARTDVPELIKRLLNDKQRVVVYRHRAHWIDVNDETALARAEALLKTYLKDWPNSAPETACGRVAVPM